jgi:pimeloyl-ACP methyl ester carboxylesterase
LTGRVDIDVAGGRLATFRLGAERSDAELVLAIHGITSSSRNWMAVARALGDRAALAAVDLRGRAASNHLPEPFGIDAHVRDMIAVLDALEVGRAVVAGHSLGAYVAARLATLAPERVRRLVLVDGGLTIALPEGVDPERFTEAFLGPAVARLSQTFADLAAYRDWWARHPAIAGSDVDPADLEEYAAHDLVGDPPRMRSSVNPQAVRYDALDLLRITDARQARCPAVLLCAPRGMVNDPNPVQPLSVVKSWVDASPDRRRSTQVPDVNHYTIALGARGAHALADAIAEAVSAER